MKTISIIIPALNEEENLETCLRNLLAVPELEIIVADGNSRDRTASLAKDLGVRVVASRPGRARQMNAGAAAASGDILLFLHADTDLPAGFEPIVRQALSEQQVAAGAFRLKIAAPGRAFRFVELLANLRSRLLGMPYGDQALFLTAERFADLGGFADLPIMEDFELLRRLKKCGRIRILSLAATTSARRWRRLGLFRTFLINQLIITGYLAGISPHRLARWYQQKTSVI